MNFKSAFKLFLSLVFTAGVFSACCFFLNRKKFFAIDHIDIVLEEIANPVFFKPYVNEVDKNLESLRGTDLWSVSLSDLAGLLSRQNWIQSIEISRRWPSELRVAIHPKKVVFIFLNKSNQFVPIMSDGVALSAVGLQQIPDVPLLVGEVFSQLQTRIDAINFIQQIPNNGNFSERSISEIRFDNKEGFVLTLVGSAMKVKMGTEKIALKAARVGQILEYMQTRQLDARVINANLSKKVLVKLRKAP